MSYFDILKEKLLTGLKDALFEDKKTLHNFQNLANSHRNTYIGWIKNAKTKTTRKRRISKVVKSSLNNKKPGLNILLKFF